MNRNSIISFEQTALIDKMIDLGADNGGNWIVTQTMHDNFIKAFPVQYEQAKTMVPPSQKQINLCEKLIDLGASFDEKFSHLKTMSEADKLIKKNIHRLKVNQANQSISRRVRVDEWGGIPNC